MRLLLLLVALPLWAADDVNAILKRLIETERKNDKAAQQYTYVEATERYVFDKDGQARKTESDTHEVIFVEGLKYEKLVAHDGKPLSPRDRARVEKDMQQTAAERRKHAHQTAPGGAVHMTGLFSHKSADLGSLSELPRLFDNRLAGEEEIRGHKVWVIESTGRKLDPPIDEHDRQVLAFRKKFWVDQKDGALVRMVHTVVAEGSIMAPGSTLTFDYERVDADVWQPISLVLEFSKSFKSPVYKPTGKTVYTMDQFHKFDVQSTITLAGQGK
jgi:hypothetical protein